MAPAISPAMTPVLTLPVSREASSPATPISSRLIMRTSGPMPRPTILMMLSRSITIPAISPHWSEMPRRVAGWVGGKGAGAGGNGWYNAPVLSLSDQCPDHINLEQCNALWRFKQEWGCRYFPGGAEKPPERIHVARYQAASAEKRRAGGRGWGGRIEPLSEQPGIERIGVGVCQFIDLGPDGMAGRIDQSKTGMSPLRGDCPEHIIRR